MPNSMDIQANQHYKTRCVAKGCSQIEGVDFNELFAAVAIGLVPGHAQGRQGHEVYSSHHRREDTSVDWMVLREAGAKRVSPRD
jgi:hypothetical protein